MERSVLFVCLGNICRSPAAEGLARAMHPAWHYDSAGTAAYHIGSAPDHRMRKTFKNHGLSIENLSARQVKSVDFDNFDYIIAMDENNFRDLASIAPKQPKAKLLKMMDFAPQFGLKGVPDPYYGEMSDFEQVYTILQQALARFFAENGVNL